MSELEPIAIVRAEDGYRGLIDAFRKRRDQLNVRGLVLDGIAGLADGHTGKLHCGTKIFGHDSFGPALGSHAMMVVLLEDLDALAAIKSRLKQRDEKQVMRGAAKHRETVIRITRKTFKKLGRIGGRTRAQKLAPKYRRAQARRAANARWQRVREQRLATINAPGQTEAASSRTKRAIKEMPVKSG